MRNPSCLHETHTHTLYTYSVYVCISMQNKNFNEFNAKKKMNGGYTQFTCSSAFSANSTVQHTVGPVNATLWALMSVSCFLYSAIATTILCAFWFNKCPSYCGTFMKTFIQNIGGKKASHSSNNKELKWQSIFERNGRLNVFVTFSRNQNTYCSSDFGLAHTQWNVADNKIATAVMITLWPLCSSVRA